MMMLVQIDPGIEGLLRKSTIDSTVGRKCPPWTKVLSAVVNCLRLRKVWYTVKKLPWFQESYDFRKVASDEHKRGGS